MEKLPVLVVDDDQDVAAEIVDIVNESGKFEAVAVYSANDCLDLLAKNRPAIRLGRRKNRFRCILLDIKMPGMDGITLLKNIREEYKPEELGVVVVTAVGDIDDDLVRQARDFGAGFIMKPFKQKTLFDAMEKYVPK